MLMHIFSGFSQWTGRRRLPVNHQRGWHRPGSPSGRGLWGHPGGGLPLREEVRRLPENPFRNGLGICCRMFFLGDVVQMARARGM